MSFVVEYTHPGLGARASSVWGTRADAEAYMLSYPAALGWPAKIVKSRRTPEIFPHCAGSPAQAVGGHCFGCGKLLTRADARAWDTPEREAAQ